MNFRFNTYALALLVLSISANTPVKASDEKTLSSSVCQGTFPSDRDDAHYLTTELLAAGGEVQMNCSLVRDIVDGTMLEVEVRFDKASLIAVKIPARVYSCNTAFHECSWKSTLNGGVYAGPGQHSFYVDTASLPHSDTYGRYFSVWARLPQGDSLMSINSREE